MNRPIHLARAALAALAVLAILSGRSQAVVVDMEDNALNPESYYKGELELDHWTSGGAEFNNYREDFGEFEYWEAWAYSNTTDTTTPGSGNESSAITGAGARDSENYAVAFTLTFSVPAPQIALPDGSLPLSLRVTNTTYAALAMENGFAQAKEFGGESGLDPDWFLLTITGRDAAEEVTGTIEFYLADYRPAGTDDDFIVTEWTNVNLTSLGAAQYLDFTLTSSDIGEFGMNTPAYFALDDLSYTALLGDADDSGLVDIFDVGTVSDHWTQEGPLGDLNGDGAVDIFDVGVVSEHWMEELPVVVPEPASIVLLLMAAACLWPLMHRRT